MGIRRAFRAGSRSWRTSAVVAAIAVTASLLGAAPAGAASVSEPVPDTIPLTGVLQVVAVEPKGPADEGTPPPAVDPAAPTTIVTLVTDDARVQITGDALDGAVSGTAFDGTVAVPEPVAQAVEQAPPTPGGPPVERMITEKAEETSVALEVVDAELTPPVLPVTPATAHTVDVMYLAPAGLAVPTAKDVDDLTARMSEYWASQSNGQISKVTRSPNYLVRTATAADVCNPDWAWNYASGSQGFNRPPAQGTDASSYYWLGGRAAHLVVIVPEDVCTWQGLGTIGDLTAGGMIWASVPSPSIEWDAVAFHEFGHNLGLGHSNTRNCSTAASDGATCSDQSYADYYDVMGGGFSVGRFNNYRDVPALNVTHRARLDALPRGTSLREVSVAGGTSQTFTMKPISDTAGLRGLEIVDPVSGDRFYVEYRSGTGRDADAFYADLSGAADSPYPDWLRPGIRVLKFVGCAGAATCGLGTDSTVLQRSAPEATGPFDDPANPHSLYYLAGDAFESAPTSIGRSGVRVRVVSTAAAQAVVEVTLDPNALPISFLDVPASHPFAAEIGWMAERGITTGYEVPGGREFRPYGTVGRDAMAAFLYRFADSSDFFAPPGFTVPADFTAPSVSPFTDVPTSHPFYKQISWLASNGVSTGWDVGGGKKEFRPAQPIARDAMAAFLYRFAGKPDFTAPPASSFTDVPTSHPFYKEISWLASTGVTTGWDVGGGKREFRPSLNITRDAMAAFLYRYHVWLD